MSELLVSEETFFEKSTACKDAILAILGGIDSNALLGINDNMSEAASTLKRSYGLFYNAIRDAVRILYVDWNVIEICVTNMIVYDGYLSSMIDGDSTAANYHAIGCSNLFTNMHAYDVDLDGSEINEARLPSYSSEDNWIITYGNIDRIDNMRFALEGFIDVCDQYLNVLNDYKETGCVQGNLADAITRYLDNVHVRLIEFIKSVTQEFHDAMNQYCISYFAEFSETGYTLFKSELTSDVVTLSNIADSYSGTINAARITIGSAIRNLRGPHMPIPYMPTLIPVMYPRALVDIINTSMATIQSVIDLVDELEANGRALADSAEEYILGLRASLENIRPMGGFRLLHYHSDDATDILDVPNVEDVTEIEVQEAVYNTEAEYWINIIVSNDPMNELDQANLEAYLESCGYTVDGSEFIAGVRAYYDYLIANGVDEVEAINLTASHAFALPTSFENLGASDDAEAIDTEIHNIDMEYSVLCAYQYVGYRETAGDHTMFNVWYYNGIDYGVYWCSIFATYWANENGIISLDPASRYDEQGHYNDNPLVSIDGGETEQRCNMAGVVNVESLYGSYGRFYTADSDYQVATGDFVTFRNGGNSHIGIVAGYDAETDTLYTIEGNSSQQVSLHSYENASNNGYVYGYCSNGGSSQNLVIGEGYTVDDFTQGTDLPIT